MDSVKNELHNEIMREYDIIRSKNSTEHIKIKENIYNHFPRIKEIDDTLSVISLKACKNMLNTSLNHDEIMSKLKADTKKLVDEKNSILSSAGMSPECMEPIYNCKLCKDKGSYNNKRCECYYKKMQKLMQKKSNINFEKMHGFETYNINLYSDVIDEDYGLSPKENTKNNYDIARKYADFGKGVSRQMLLYGSTGLGKTFTSECIAREFIKKGKDVYYTSAPRLFSLFEDYKFGRNTTAEAKKIIDYISTVDLLIIDDLGTEFRTQYIDSILFDIVNTRINENQHIIISTNLTPSQIETTYSQRISSRILGNFELMLFFGNDLRLG